METLRALIASTCLAALAVAGCGSDGGGGGGSDPDAANPFGFDAAAGVFDAAGPGCGNGVIDDGETCDPPDSCPTTCDDGLGCSIDTMVGAAATCNVACERVYITECVAADGCCPAGCSLPDDDDCFPYALDPDFAMSYEIHELGAVDGVPSNYGGLVIHPDDPDTLIIGGAANTAAGALYTITLTRGPLGHITGLVGTATMVSEAAYNDGGVVFGPDDVMFLARWPQNELGQKLRASVVTDKVVDLTPLGVVSSPGGLAFVPPGHPGAGALKLVSWSGGQWYDLTIAADGGGFFDVTAATQVMTIVGGPEGIAYIPLGSPHFDNPSVLVSEYSAGAVSAYEVDASGDPVMATRRDFLVGLTGAEGAAIDPISGDFLFSTFGGGDRIVVVRGFSVVID